MANTFDTSRVGGGTYELAKDANGNYNLKSVGFKKVNKLNLPDLTTGNSTIGKPILKPVDKPDIADPFKKLAAQNTSSGGESNQDYSGVMLKNAEVNEASVRNAGDAMVKVDTGKTTGKFLASGAAGSASLRGEKQSDGFLTSGAAGGARLPSQVQEQKPGMLSTPQQQQETFAARATGLQKITSKAKATKTKVASAIKMAASAILPGAGLVISGLQAIAPKDTATQKMNKSLFSVNEGSRRISGNAAEDLYAGMNRTSDFGNLEKAGNKRIANRTKTIARRGIKSDLNPKGISQKFVDRTEKMKDQARSYKQAKETATDTSPGATGGEGGSSGSDSGRVICTDLHRTGELSTKDWIRDTKFTFKTLSITHVKGYLLWAEPTVKHMQKYPRYRKMWKHIAQHRANDIAWRLNEGKFDLLGRIYAGIGEPVCWALGNFVSDKQISKYNLTHWRRA